MKKPIRERLERWIDNSTDPTSQLGQNPKALPAPPEDSHTARPVKRLELSELWLFRRVYPVVAVVLGLAIVSVLMLTVFSLPRFGGDEVPANNEVAHRYIADGPEETGAVNMVAGMILDYRAFDTLGESHVLFTGVCAVILLLEAAAPPRLSRKKRQKLRAAAPKPRLDLTQDPILRQAALILVPVIFVYGIYVVLNGHLSPGGGFSGGAILGAGLILFSAAFGFEQTERFMNRRTFRVVTFCALAFYSLAKCWSFFTGANGLESGISTGTLGNIFSAGLIMPLDIAVGAVVACTMYGLYSLFQRGKIG